MTLTDEHVRNIRSVFDAATPLQIGQGATWYLDAYQTARNLALDHGVTVEQAAGVIAAVSPRSSWGSNVSLASRILDLHDDGITATRGYLSIGLVKAARILAGERPDDVLTSDKVRAFYHCIVTGGLTDEVCVDRHAYCIAWNMRSGDVTVTKTAYRRIANAYREVAHLVGIPAAHVQAVTWLVWRSRHGTEGARDRPTRPTVG